MTKFHKNSYFLLFCVRGKKPGVFGDYSDVVLIRVQQLLINYITSFGEIMQVKELLGRGEDILRAWEKGAF